MDAVAAAKSTEETSEVDSGLRLPPGWALATLSKLVGTDGLMLDGDWVESKDQDPSGSVRLIQLADIGEGRFLDRSSRFLTEDTAHRLRCTFLRKGDVLIARMASPLGRACVYPELTLPAVTVVDVRIWRSNPELVHPRWLMHTINSLQCRRSILSDASGTTRQRISGGKLKDIIVPVPPFAEQRRIVARVDELFAEIAEGEAALAEARKGLDIFRRALLKAAVTGELTKGWRAISPANETAHDMLARISADRWSNSPPNPRTRRAAKATVLDTTNLPQLPATWMWVTIRELADVIGGLTKNPDREKLPDRVPYLRVANVQAGSLDLTEVKEIGVTKEDRERASLLPGDLLVVEGNGSIDQIGRCAIWNGEIPACVHQNHIIKVRVSDAWLSRWCLTWLLSPHGREEIERVAASTSGLHTLSLSKIETLPIPIPPRAEAIEIVRRVSGALAASVDTLAQLETEAADAARLKQSILKAAFEGRLVPQDPSDEPASALLARLAAGPGAPRGRRIRGKSSAKQA